MTNSTPAWDDLFALASSQAGHFTTQQAAEVGYSTPLIHHHLQAGRFQRIRRGIYRLTHYPPAEHEALTVLWLWSDQQGVFSHQTALMLHGLSDVLPAQAHMTLPNPWRKRRLRIPDGLVLHFADVGADQQRWFEAVPATDAATTLNDCARAALAPDLLRQAAVQALDRGLATLGELSAVVDALQPFGGLRP
ncbi:MAG: type IV toxin-antitoxin system AbiEi family antitoxin domain-containing protein [Myxococcales bacterium]|nr:type IV toxin-antitoxin system AbiEi family antitoxin domain-containing protein [Myxococcales bacterium]